jgi:hypothetical protein
VEPHAHRARLGKRAGSRAARALGALEVGRLDMVRGFLGAGGDAPPARWPSTAARAAAPTGRAAPVRSAAPHDAGLRPCWWTG